MDADTGPHDAQHTQSVIDIACDDISPDPVQTRPTQFKHRTADGDGQRTTRDPL